MPAFTADETLAAVSTHSRPKAAGAVRQAVHSNGMGFNTQPPEGGWWAVDNLVDPDSMFQHTAARRRLVIEKRKDQMESLFQHTAARRRLGRSPVKKRKSQCFNTQPPEGGWQTVLERIKGYVVSTHSRPKAAGRKH